MFARGPGWWMMTVGICGGWGRGLGGVVRWGFIGRPGMNGMAQQHGKRERGR